VGGELGRIQGEVRGEVPGEDLLGSGRIGGIVAPLAVAALVATEMTALAVAVTARRLCDESAVAGQVPNSQSSRR